ncbi:MAG: hypothetical protein RLY86_82 [Pseudomonadota bacterium]|jgi:glycosyltransferase involved in cell wall biosynthesis
MPPANWTEGINLVSKASPRHQRRRATPLSGGSKITTMTRNPSPSSTDAQTGLRHVALFMHGFEAGGAQRRTLALAGALAERGLQVDMVVVVRQGPLAAELPRFVRLVRVGGRAATLPPLSLSRPTRLLAGVHGLAEYLRESRPQVLVAAANHAIVAALAAHFLAGATGTRLVLRISNALTGGRDTIRDRLKRWTVRRFYGRADRVVAVSADMAREITTLVPALAARTEAAPNPVIPPDLQIRAAEPVDNPVYGSWFDDGGPPVILGLGRLEPQKDFPTLLRAVASLRRTRPVRLLILGDGGERAGLERLADGLGLGPDALCLPGFTANPFPVVARAACFVLSSRWEGMPGALIEAMALGCPVVSTDCPGGSREVLCDGALGPLVPVGDPGALAAAIARVLDSGADRAALRERAQDFTVDRAADAYLAALERALAGPVRSADA